MLKAPGKQPAVVWSLAEQLIKRWSVDNRTDDWSRLIADRRRALPPILAPPTPTSSGVDESVWPGKFAQPNSPGRSTVHRTLIANRSTAAAEIRYQTDRWPTSGPYRPYDNETDFSLDRRLIGLLQLDSAQLPKPSDPLSFCFHQHRHLRRKFVPVDQNDRLDADADAKKAVFSVCSYNVLCQQTLSGYIEQLYSHCPLELLSWRWRWPLLAAELQMLDADVFCLQEVQHDHYERCYKPLLANLGYDGVFKKRTQNKHDGCATFWRRNQFRAVDIHQIEFSLPPPYHYSNNVAVIAVLQPISPQAPSGSVIVSNTHLIFQPASGAVKLCQLALLLAHLQKVVNDQTRSTGVSPATIVCGDFNSAPFSSVYSFIKNGYLEYEGLHGSQVSGQWSGRRSPTGDSDRLVYPLIPIDSGIDENCQFNDDHRQTLTDQGCLRHDFNLRSVYDHFTSDGDRETTTLLRDQAVGVDYIFYADQSGQHPAKGRSLRCLERYSLPGETRLRGEIGYLPNQFCASDHIPLLAKFALSADGQ